MVNINAIESVNSVIRKAMRNSGHFPSEAVILKSNLPFNSETISKFRIDGSHTKFCTRPNMP